MVATTRKLSAAQVDRNLKQALQELRKAERNAVLWFSEILSRKLYRSLGYSSVHQYASEELGFSKGKTSQFIRLCASLEALPALRETVRTGEVSWTKAREVVRVATPKTEDRWVALARGSSRREIEKKVEECRRRARVVRNEVPGQGTLLGGEPGKGGCAGERGGGGAWTDIDGEGGLNGARSSGSGSLLGGNCVPGPGGGAFPPVPGASPPSSSGGDVRDEEHPPVAPQPTSDRGATNPRANGTASRAEVPEVPMSLDLRFSPREYARYEALLERIRKLGRRDRREQLFLEGLAALVEEMEIPGKLDGDGGRQSEQRKPSGEEKAAGKRSHEDPPAHIDAVPQEAPTRTQVAPASRRSPASTRSASSSPYQIVVQRCPDCASGFVVTGRDPRRLSLAELEAILCDCREEYKGRNRAAVPPSVRRRVLARDGYRCRAAGCGRTRFLEVHHLVPRGRSGPNSPENLLSLCSGCHALVHELGKKRTAALFPRGNSSRPEPRTPEGRNARPSAATVPGKPRRPAP